MKATWKLGSIPTEINFALFSECGDGTNWIMWNMIIDTNTGLIISNNEFIGPPASSSDDSFSTIEYSADTTGSSNEGIWLMISREFGPVKLSFICFSCGYAKEYTVTN
jgi:hypothetical protein